MFVLEIEVYKYVLKFFHEIKLKLKGNYSFIYEIFGIK